MSVSLNNIAIWPAIIPTNNLIQEYVIEGVEIEMNDVHSGLDNNIQEASQYDYAQNIRRPRAATTMNSIEEEVIEEVSTTEANEIVGGPDEYNEEAAQQEEQHCQQNQRAAMTASLTETGDYFTEQIRPMMGDILSKAESLIVNAAQHEHNQDVPACTDDHHNKHCGRGIDTALMEYNHLRSKGVISERAYEHWGCDTPERKAYLEDLEKVPVKMAFRPVKWDSGYTGRGLTRRAMKQPDDIGPMNEIEPSNASPLQMQRQRRRQTPKVFRNCNKEGHQPRRPDFLDNDMVAPFGESLHGQNVSPYNETTPPHGAPSARKTSTQDIGALLTKTARAGWELLERETGYNRGQTTPASHVEDISRESQPNKRAPIPERAAGAPNPAVGTLEITYSQRNKRRREPTEDLGHEESELDDCVPRSKRLKTSGGNTDEVPGPKENGLRQYPHINRPSGRIRDLLNTVTTIDTGLLEQQQAATCDGRTVKREHNVDDDAKDINVRPTYAEEDSEEEGNEAEEIVVMDIRSVDPDSVCLSEHTPKAWTDEEVEHLRLWVQDYGVTNWTKVAWCLKRSEAECKTMCRYRIMVLNRRARRDLYAGMPEDLISIPPMTAPAPSAPTVPLTSPTITTKSLRPRTRHAAPKFQCGEIVYDIQAKSLPKLAKNGNVVDNRGNVILGWPGEVALALKVSQPRRKAGQKSRLTIRPQMENEQDDAQVSQPRRKPGQKLRLFVRPRTEHEPDNAPTIDDMQATDAPDTER